MQRKLLPMSINKVDESHDKADACRGFYDYKIVFIKRSDEIWIIMLTIKSWRLTVRGYSQ